MIKAIVFDFDGMVFISDAMFSERLSRDFGISIKEITEFFKSEFSECQKGGKDLKESIKPYLDKWGWNKSVDELLDYWFEYGRLDEEIVGFIEQLKKQGIICVLGTNNEKHRMKYLENNFSLSSLFDLVVASCEIGTRKPDPEFYAEILKDIKLKPKEVVVFDDKEEHIEKLEKMGFVPLIYQEIKGFKYDLEKLGIFGNK